VAAGERNAFTVANAYTNTNTDSNPYANACTKSYSDAIGIVCPSVERHSGLYGRYDCKCERRQLCCQLLDPKSKSDNQQWRAWQWAAVDKDGNVRNAIPNADSYSNSHAQPNSHSYADAESHSDTESNAYADSFSRQLAQTPTHGLLAEL
jgi:hypothetical protein